MRIFTDTLVLLSPLSIGKICSMNALQLAIPLQYSEFPRMSTFTDTLLLLRPLSIVLNSLLEQMTLFEKLSIDQTLKFINSQLESWIAVEKSFMDSLFPRMRIFTDTLLLFIPLSMMTSAISTSYLKTVLQSSHHNELFHIAEDEDLHRHIGVLQTPVHGVELYRT